MPNLLPIRSARLHDDCRPRTQAFGHGSFRGFAGVSSWPGRRACFQNFRSEEARSRRSSPVRSHSNHTTTTTSLQAFKPAHGLKSKAPKPAAASALAAARPPVAGAQWLVLLKAHGLGELPPRRNTQITAHSTAQQAGDTECP